MRLLRGDDDDAEFEHADQQTGSLLNAPMKWLSPLLRHFSSSSAPAPRSSSSSSRPSYYSRVIPALRWLRGRVSVWYALHDQLAPAHHGTPSCADLLHTFSRHYMLSSSLSARVIDWFHQASFCLRFFQRHTSILRTVATWACLPA